jgi:hypothetical protein
VDYNFWTPTLIGIVGLVLMSWQIRLMKKSTLKGKASSGILTLRYWPVVVMFLLMLSSWIPYFFVKPECPPDIFLAWGANNGRIYAVIRTTVLLRKKPDRLMLIARIEDNSIPYASDTQIARSATFEILDPSTAIEVTPPPDFTNKAGLVDIYILEVKQDFPFESVHSLADAEKLGGKS